MIETALLNGPPNEVCYTGIDLFEARIAADGPGVTLKMAHRMLKSTGVRVKLVPGDSFSALARTANSLRETDLVVISSRQDPEIMARSWYFIPRVLHSESLVLREETRPGGRLVLRSVSRDELQGLAQAASLSRAA